jgi:hypothetical protein
MRDSQMPPVTNSASSDTETAAKALGLLDQTRSRRLRFLKGCRNSSRDMDYSG